MTEVDRVVNEARRIKEAQVKVQIQEEILKKCKIDRT